MSFQDLHRNHKMAFLDGVLTTSVFAFIAFRSYKAKRDTAQEAAIREAESEMHTTAFHSGWDHAKDHYTKYYTEAQKKFVFGDPE